MQSEKELGANMHEAMLQEILTEVQGYCHHNSPASVLDKYSKETLFWALDGMLSRERALKRASLRTRAEKAEADAQRLYEALKAQLEATPQEQCDLDCNSSNCPWVEARAAIAAHEEK